jgi:hypothetical protein
MPTQTQTMPAQAMAAEPAGIRYRRSRVRPAWLLAAAGAAAAFIAFAAFAAPGVSNSTPTPMATPTSPPSSHNNSATESTGTTTEIAPPAGNSPIPGQLNRAKGKARSHNNAKDGKQ